MVAFPAAAGQFDFSCKFGKPTLSAYQLLADCSTLEPVVLGDKRLTLNTPENGEPSLYQLPTIGSGAILFEWEPNEIEIGDGYLNDVWSVTVDFSPNLAATSPTPMQGVFRYTLEVLADDWIFATVDLDGLKTESLGQIGGEVKVSKLLPGGYLSPDAPLISTNGSNVDPVPLGADYSYIAVTDFYDLSKGSKGLIFLDKFANNFTQQRSSTIPPEADVPASLPLLGISSAFGFSRRLRRRLLRATQQTLS